MSVRTSLPSTLTSPILTRSGEGVTFVNPSPAVVQPSPVRTQSNPVSPTPMAAPPVQRASVMPVQTMTKQPVQRGFEITPMLIIILVLIFIVVAILLYVTKSNMVTDLVDGERVINNSKLAFWTVLISIIIGVVLLVGLYMWKRV